MMSRSFMIASAMLALSITASGQADKGRVDATKIPAVNGHYQPEYTFDSPSDPSSWAKQGPGLHVSFGSTDEGYLRCEVPPIDPVSYLWESAGWRGERLNAQVLAWSPDTIGQVRFRATDLVSASGGLIGKDRIKLYMVRYVLSNYPYGAEYSGCNATLDSAWLVPDRFETFERFDIPGRTVRPVWITLDIPGDAKPGEYSGTIEVASENQKFSLALRVTVQEQVLPDPREWKFRLDLWQNPWVVSTHFKLEPWSADHVALLKKHLELYASAGGKFITTYAIHSPWSDNSYTLEGTMIEWIRKANGSWKFDYTIFDRYVELAMEAGIDGAITVYTPIPWGARFRYLDESSGNYRFETWPPDSPLFREHWTLFLEDLKAHLVSKGWFGRTYLGINENPLGHTLAAIKVIRDHSSDWKITYAGDWHPELSQLVDDYSPVIQSEPTAEELEERMANGLTTTYYVCCTPPLPNTFVFSHPSEGRFLGWYSAARGYDGFLRWAYDAWPADPERDARHVYWPAGDCFLVYPGAVSCIRFEKLRQGIADYEKIRILREAAAISKDPEVKRLTRALEAHLRDIAGETEYSKRGYHAAMITDAVRKGELLIRELSRAVGQ